MGLCGDPIGVNYKFSVAHPERGLEQSSTPDREAGLYLVETPGSPIIIWGFLLKPRRFHIS